MSDQKRIDDLGSLQRTVMEDLWQGGEATVQELLERLDPASSGAREAKRPAYTTVLSVLQKLEKAGWVRHRSEGRTYVWCAARSRREEGKRAVRSFLGHVFGGDPKALFQHLIEGGDLDEDDLSAFQRMIDERRGRSGRGDAEPDRGSGEESR